MIKKTVFVVLAAVAVTMLWWTAKSWLADPLNPDQWREAVPPLVWLILSLTAYSLVMVLLPRRWAWLAFILGLASFFWQYGADKLLLGGAGLAALLYAGGLKSVGGERKNSLKFHFFPAARGGVYRLITAIFILISFAYFLTPGVQATSKRQELPSGVSKTVQVIVGNYVSESSERQNPHRRSQLTAETLRQLNTFLKPYFHFLPPIFAFGLFLFLQGIGFLIVWVTLALSSLIFLMLKLFKIVTMEKVSKEAEDIKF